MVGLSKVVLASCATAAVAVSVTACGGSTTSSTASSAASAASSVASSATSAIAAAAAEGTLASVCTEIDGVMMGKPDADPAGTAAQLEAIKAKVSTPDADLIENVAAAYSAIAADPADTEAQSKLSTSATALGAGCQTATTVPGPN
ncbi:MAG: hypothetical protein ACR2JI_17360 [Mycobacterium sp.]